MVSLVLKSVLLRFILPVVLLIGKIFMWFICLHNQLFNAEKFQFDDLACLLRPSVISFLYGVLVLISQLVPTITSNSVSGESLECCEEHS